jgi:hypothetical protein
VSGAIVEGLLRRWVNDVEEDDKEENGGELKKKKKKREREREREKTNAQINSQPVEINGHNVGAFLETPRAGSPEN